jgi:hypothetical protein
MMALDYCNEKEARFTVVADDGKIYKPMRSSTTQPPITQDAHPPPAIGVTCNPFQQKM